ncbi:pyruvate dehydrogenase E2 component (dihydrolipoamide acetyltransferase) [Planifilum fimeticola]|uniref:Dihydrolipoamide acetyltransferase component of pyruvate dehydrogenase complex n=1 Tax=Planifilum fimeticola TaxID=201975 RepID=A0A2T0LB62_9BACL|nr:dihydrolipoamide acetyltransferase family protein [Planifilum fimeticola]PRX39124.1 pyruvate dehydrogenase E2 component (dihydrolipoamide acetyltransferase) [Planifilum fimeticola]
MAVDFKLPDVGEGMAEAEVVRWLVRVGDRVELDQPVVEMQTDKAVVELPAPAAGRVTEIRWREGDTVPVGEVLLVIADESGEKGKEETEKGVRTEANQKASGAASSASTFTRRRRVPAAPSTRRLARELGVDITQIKGTGSQGRVTDEDVRRAAAALQEPAAASLREPVSKPAQQVAVSAVSTEAPADLPYREEPLTRTRRVIADRLLFSVTRKPHATHFDELKADGLVEWIQRRRREQESSGPRISFLPVLLKMIAVTLRNHPAFNAHFDEDRQTVRTYQSVALGIAADTPRGLLVPVIAEVEKKSVEQIAGELAGLTEAARNGTIPPERLKGSTFTVSNAGALGSGRWATPIINPPEVAILALHPVEQRPVVRDGELSVGWVMNVSLSFDHRVLDGADAIRFTQTLARYVADPGRLLTELV